MMTGKDGICSNFVLLKQNKLFEAKAHALA
jgi:hypothetical protein